MDKNESVSLDVGQQNVSIITRTSKPNTISVNFEKRRATKKQLLVTSSSVTGSIGYGLSVGFTATLLPQIKASVDTTAGSWLAGSVALSMPVGVLIASILMRRWGRRPSQIISNVPWLFGWPCISLAAEENFPMMMIGCSLIGISTGLYNSVSIVYITEICAPHVRSLVTIAISVGVSIGILLSHVLGIALFWRTALGCSVLIPGIAFVLAFFSVETPNWLILKGRVDEAEKIFTQVRGSVGETALELNILLGKRMENVARKRRGLLRNMCSSDFLKALLITCFLFGVQQASGLNMVAFYAVDVLTNMSSSLDAHTATILIDLVRVISSLASFYCVKIMKRRLLFFWSAASTVLSLMTIVAALLYGWPNTVVIFAMCWYIASVYVGILPVPWLMSAELYPAVLRDFGTSITSIYAFLSIFAIVKAGPLLLHTCGAPLTFTIFALAVLVGSLVLYFIMPETKGNTLQQIEDTIAGRR